jgi:hypothetical protein
MHIQKMFRIFRSLIAFSVIFLLASCGGGGDGCNASNFAFGSIGGAICKNNQPSISTAISGVAAGGAPIIGNVEITDKFGVKRGMPINDDGTYKLDVSGMNGPFIVKAHGNIAGVSVTYYSAGTEADVGGTINVTPFTDLILSSIAGKLVNLYLSDESKIPAFAALLTREKIDKSQDALFATLKPILIQLGVKETINLIRTVFKADHSGVDALMDLVKVEYDLTTNVAALRNMITMNKMAEIDVTQPIPLSPIPPSNYKDIDISAADDVREIGAVLKGLENLFAVGLPTAEKLTSSGLFDTSDDFTQGGESFKQFIDEYAKIDKIDSNVLEIVNTAFKTHQDFSKEISSEAALRISDEDFEEFCINNINDKSMITLSLDDPRLGEFVKIYKDLKTVYLDNCEYLLTLLEKNILDKEKVSEKNDNPRFALKNIGFSDLSSFETDVRNRLVSMYSQCQEHYQKGIMALYTALKTPAE